MTSTAKPERSCSRNGCTASACCTLTFNYQSATAVIGPLSVQAEPHCYDLCAEHSQRFSAPIGWEVISLTDPESLAAMQPREEPDDLLDVAHAVRENPAANRPPETTEYAAASQRRKPRLAPGPPPTPQQQNPLRVVHGAETHRRLTPGDTGA